MFDSEANNYVSGSRIAGSLLRVLVAKSSSNEEHSTMASAHPILDQHGYPQSACDKFGGDDDPFAKTSLTAAMGSTAHLLPTDEFDFGTSPFQSDYTQDWPAIDNPVSVHSSKHQSMAADPRFSYDNSFGAVNHISPSKRVFSSLYLNSNAMVTSELDHTPSSKRHAGLAKSCNYMSIEKKNQGAIENAEPVRRVVAKPRARRATHSVGGESNSAVPAMSEDYSKYYQFLAEKHNIEGHPVPNEDGARSQVYVSPSKSTNYPPSSNQKQQTRVNSATNSISQASAPLAIQANPSARRGQPDQQSYAPQQNTGPRKLATYNAIEEKVRQRTEIMLDSQKAQIEVMKQRRANKSLGSHHQSVGPSAYAQSIPSLCVPHQTGQWNMVRGCLQNTTTSHNPYAEYSSLESSRLMGEKQGMNSGVLSPSGFSAENLGCVPVPANAFPQQIGLGPIVDSYDGATAVQWLDTDCGSEIFTVGASAQCSMDNAQANVSSSTLLQPASHSYPHTACQALPRTDINKILPAFRQEYQAYEENLMNGVQTQTSLPPWLVTRAQQKARLLPVDIDSESDDDCAQVPQEAPTYQRIIATAETGPLPNINQPYTGTLNPSSPRLAAHLAYNNMMMPRMPIWTPYKKTTAPKKSKKTPTRRKSRAKKPSQVDSRPITPPDIVSQAPSYDFFSPMNGIHINNSTLENMMVGNFVQFFGSAEEEAKWKQDAVAEVMAEQDTPSKRQLKMAEQQRKKLEKNVEAER